MTYRAAGKTAFLVLALAIVSGLHAASAVHATIGTPIENREMATADGGTSPALRDVEASVLVFFRPEQPRSGQALKELAQCQAPFTGKSVYWAAVVSDSSALDKATSLVQDSKFVGSVLIDKGDALYGSLGIALHPVLVIIDKGRKLAAFEPFRAVNFCAVVTARLRYQLKEIADEELRVALDPPAAPTVTTGNGGQRYRSLAEALLRSGNLDKALENINKAIEADPAPARSHAVLGEVLRARGDCAGAALAYTKALAIEPAQAMATKGLESCKTGR